MCKYTTAAFTLAFTKVGMARFRCIFLKNTQYVYPLKFEMYADYIVTDLTTCWHLILIKKMSHHTTYTQKKNINPAKEQKQKNKAICLWLKTVKCVIL